MVQDDPPTFGVPAPATLGLPTFGDFENPSERPAVSMTVGKAKAIISSIWLFVGSEIFGFVVYLTVLRKLRFSVGDWAPGLS